jgi:hypothetical protein
MIEAQASFPSTLEELVSACVSFHRKRKDSLSVESARQRRADLARFARTFHSECGTLTPSVQESIEDLEEGNCIVLMTAHQPNFFAYSGVLRKTTLNFVLASKLESLLKVPIVSFFGIADQDFTDDRWVRSCELPAVQRSEGVLSIEVKLPERLMLNKVAKPSDGLLLEWRSEIEKWLSEAIGSIQRLSRDLGFQEACSASTVSALHKNFEYFWNIVEGCWRRSSTYSDFNSFLMSEIVNDAWGYDTVFARFSECQQAFVDDFSFLLSHFQDYSRLLSEARKMSNAEGNASGVSEQEPFLAPFWYHCSCGSKAKLLLEQKDGHLVGSGDCVRCQKHYELDLGHKDEPNLREIASHISARAIPMGLVFFNGLQPCCYVGGAAGAAYLTEAAHVARGLGSSFPVIVVWRPYDRYLGVGQMEVLSEVEGICRDLGAENVLLAKNLLNTRLSEIQGRLERLERLKSEAEERLRNNPGDGKLKREIREASVRRTNMVKSSRLSVVCLERKVFENASKALGLMPSIIDYAVSVGLKETSDQWIRHLNEGGDFHSSVKLESVLEQDIVHEGFCAWESLFPSDFDRGGHN